MSADAKAILESMGDAFYATDGAWRIRYANQRALGFWNLPAEAVLGRVIWERFPELAGSRMEALLRRAHAEQRTITAEAFAPAAHRWIAFRAVPAGEGIAVYWHDVTERVLVEQGLRDSEEHLRLAQEAADLGTWEWDLHEKRIRWSAHMFHLIGAEPAQGFLPQQAPLALWEAALHPEDREAAKAAARRASRRVGTFAFEFRLLRNDAVQWILSRGRVLPDEAGRPRRMLGINLDITERKRAEQELRDSEQAQRRFAALLEQRVADRTAALEQSMAALRRSQARYQAIFAHAPVDLMLFTVQPDGRVVFEDTNPSWTRHTGFARDSTLGRSLEEVLGPEQGVAVLAQYRRAIETGEPIDFEFNGRYAIGDVIRQIFVVPLRGLDGRVEQLLVTGIDLTEKRRMETALREAQKMEAIGQLTGGVAHDFNNLLTVVLGNLELLDARLTQDSLRRYVIAAVAAAQRGGQLTQQLLAYARRQRLTPQPVDVNAAIAGMGELLQRSLGGLVQVETQLAPDLWPAVSDPTQLELLILNLAINARDAMPGGGRLVIATRNVPPDETGLPPELTPGAYTLVTVTDSGTGMPPEILERALEPFFTTKEPGKGSGLGLAQVYGLTRQFGGTVRLASTPGTGTTVEVFLPRAGARPAEPTKTAPRSQPTPRPGAGRVLVVDDDHPVRAVAAGFLAEAGFSVAEAGSGAEALAILKDGPVALALIDFAMPIMSGAELVRLARTLQPGLRVIFVTGNAESLPTDALANGESLLTKPYSKAELLHLVHDTIGKV